LWHDDPRKRYDNNKEGDLWSPSLFTVNKMAVIAAQAQMA